MNAKIVTLDVRDDLRSGQEPFSKIMSTVAALRDDEQFLLIVPFQPVPLFDVMKRRGFSHDAGRIDSGDWKVLFTRDSENAPADAGNLPTPRSAETRPDERAPGCTVTATKIVEVDVRGMEPPQPLVVILEAVAALPDGATLCARTARRPIHLYARLEELGFIAETVEQFDGSFLTHIRRR